MCRPAGRSASVKPAAQTAVIDSGPGGRRGAPLRCTLTGKARILILVSFLGPPLLRLDMVASSVGSCIHMKVFSQEGQLGRLVRGAADERSLHLEAPRPGTEGLLLTAKRQISCFFAQQWRTTCSSHCAELTHSKSRERWAILKQTGVFKNRVTHQVYYGFYSTPAYLCYCIPVSVFLCSNGRSHLISVHIFQLWKWKYGPTE